MVSRRVSESDLTALISHETVQPHTLCEFLLCGLSGLLSAGLWRQLRLLLHALRHTVPLPCSPSNGILSVVALRYSPMSVILSAPLRHCLRFTSSSPPNSLRLLLRLLSSLSPSRTLYRKIYGNSGRSKQEHNKGRIFKKKKSVEVKISSLRRRFPQS